MDYQERAHFGAFLAWRQSVAYAYIVGRMTGGAYPDTADVPASHWRAATMVADHYLRLRGQTSVEDIRSIWLASVVVGQPGYEGDSTAPFEDLSAEQQEIEKAGFASMKSMVETRN